MTENEYNNMRPGDVIFNLKNKEAYIVKEVCEGFVRWEDGGSTPSRYLKGWDYVSLMREREEKPKKIIPTDIPQVKFPLKKTNALRVGDIVGPIKFDKKNFTPFSGFAKVIETKIVTNDTTLEDELIVIALLSNNHSFSLRIKLDNNKEYPLMWREPE